jgi:MOSC domain-containing protein YiiM
MFNGQLLRIAVAATAGGPMIEVPQIEVRVGQGLRGDRYAEGHGTFQRGRVEPKQHVTLIEAEAITAAAQEYNLPIDHLSTRRNLLTQGVPLNHLVGRTFSVGDIMLRGVMLCEPCKHLEKLAGSGWYEALKHRGGLRAEVVRGGLLVPGARIRPGESTHGE